MSNHEPIYQVVIDANGVVLEKLKPSQPGYRKARQAVILRQRDAIETFRKLKAGRGRFHGTYAFQFLDTARTFAMLRLQAAESAIQDNLDRILAYDGNEKRSRD